MRKYRIKRERFLLAEVISLPTAWQALIGHQLTNPVPLLFPVPVNDRNHENQCGNNEKERKGLFASLMEFDLKDIFVILEIKVACKDGPAAS
jgi:hypothetical protein